MILNGQGEDNGVVENNNDRFSSKQKTNFARATQFFFLFVSRKYPYHPHGRDRIFQGGGMGVNLPDFPGGRGVHQREIFLEGSRDA